MATHDATISSIHDTVVHAWRSGQVQTLYRTINVNPGGTVTVRRRIMETTFDPHGSEESLRRFLTTYIK